MRRLDRIRSYSELARLETFRERFEYLELGGTVGARTFGGHRWLNQKFYSSSEWKRFRRQIILRDDGCDLGVRGYDIFGRVYIHHINPIDPEDVIRMDPCVLDPENVILVTFDTHEAIHYGNDYILKREDAERSPGDTCPWKGAR